MMKRRIFGPEKVCILFLTTMVLASLANAGDPPVADVKQEVAPKSFEKLRMVFVGDIMLDNGPGHVISSGKDPFIHCRDILLDADLTIGNLECVVGFGGEAAKKPFVFRAANHSEQVIKPYFDAVSLANNHTYDFGELGFRESLRVLEAAGVPYFGGGRTIAEARKPLVLESKGRRIAMIGCNEFYSEDYEATASRAGNVPLNVGNVIEDIEHAKRDLNCDTIIVFVHWGEELVAQPRKDQRDMSKRWIDAGASAIVGMHPHVIQTIDVYRGKPIVYSLGNFVFDYFPSDPPEWIGWILTLEISPEGQIDFVTTAVTIDSAGLPHLIDEDSGLAIP